MIRNLILSADKRLKEEIKWNVPCFSNKKNVCYIMAQSKHLNLGFYFGQRLAVKDNYLKVRVKI